MPTAISLFTGVGGLDFGFDAAGFKTLVAVEMDSIACKVLRANTSWPVIEADLTQIDPADILAVAKKRPGEIDILIGGPPCQPFSKSGYWLTGDSRRLADPRADTLAAYLKVLEYSQPKTFLLENVQGLAFKSKDDGLRFLLDGIAEINRRTGSKYTVSGRVLNAADFGVPQVRERFFLVGSRDGEEFNFPKPTHSGTDPASLPYVTAWDAIGDIEHLASREKLELGGKWADLLPSIPEGQNYLWHTPRGGGMPLFGWRTRYWSFLLKLAKDKPSWTIQAQPGSSIGPFHWSNRRLSTQELCRLQTLPEGLLFDCGRSSVQKLIGNAVPSYLAEVLAWEIRRQLLGHEVSPAHSVLQTRVAKQPAKNSAIAVVPKKYRELAASHADHPGTGKGKGAQARQDKKVLEQLVLNYS
ncbi:MAG TPA: DNA cytosine methyltransferase [Devosiaceae bacterium]